MASQKNFAITPSVSISRSKFKRPFQHKTSFNLGEIVPVYLDQDILPGDTVSIDMSTLIRMSTPVAPIMDNIHIDYYAFFTPNRLLDPRWKQFMGENTSSYGAASTVTFNRADIYANGFTIGETSLGHYLGLPLTQSGSGLSLTVSRFPGLNYVFIYNEWFRDQNLIAPLALGSGTNVLATDPNNGNANYSYGSNLLLAAKDSDYFTRALPYAQKGSPVTLPLGNYAPLVATDTFRSMTYTSSGGSIYKASFRGSASTPLGGTYFGLDNSGNLSYGYDQNSQSMTGVSNLNYTNLVADLSNATAATINNLRFAFQYQKFLEKDALYGTRYWEILKGHFGITAPDASLQRPELLGHWRQHINIDQVLQTTGYNTTPSSNELGTPGANSVTAGHSSFFTKSFVEHGILMIVAVARHDQTYGQGVDRSWTRTKREDYYFPVFANLSAQVVKNKEIFARGSSGDESVFGYQEAWAEYRYKPSLVSGALDPNGNSSLGFWTLANRFGSLPTLSKSFIEQDRDAISVALVSGSSGPDFIADFYFDSTYVRPMPMYSIPGLIDHH